jgi:integrase/recombinase XerD
MNPLRRRAEEYLGMRRALGYKLERHGLLLLQFVDYLEHAQAPTITVDLAVAWAKQPCDASPAWWSLRLSVIRGFARHLHTLDPANEVLLADLLPGHYHRHAPYLYSAAEIAALVDATFLLAAPLRAATFRALIGLLAVTGMRVGEAVRLDRDAVDLDTSMLTIIKSKHGQSRQLPLHPSAAKALGDYARRRDHLLVTAAVGPSFFVSSTGNRLSVSAIDAVFTRLLYHAGIQPTPGRRTPRVHDLRHSFTVATHARQLPHQRRDRRTTSGTRPVDVDRTT